MRFAAAMLSAIGLSLALGGCASVKETYYLSTYDPATDARNYFRIKVRGFSSASKIKFSVGFYDKSAVERLFGEQLLQREYLSSEVDVFDAETGERLADVGDQIARARAAEKEDAIDRLRLANATVSGLLIKYEIRLYTIGKLDEYQGYLNRIREAHEKAEGLLGQASIDDDARTKAHNAVTEALVGLHAIRVAVDGDVLVRFFDGAGNEVDVSSMTQVIFVANDVSRFAEAIRQLAEDSEIQSQVLDIVLGSRMADAQRAAAEATESDERAEWVSAALEQLLASNKIEVEEGQEPPALEADVLRQMALDAAATIAEGPSSFESSQDIRDYVEGREQ